MKNEKQLLSLPVDKMKVTLPGVTTRKVKNRYNGMMYTETYFTYGYTICILNNNILSMTIYNYNDGCAEYRIFIDAENHDYIAEKFTNNEWYRSTAKPSTLYPRWDNSKLFIADEDSIIAAVKWLGKYKQDIESHFRRICEYVDSIGERRLKAKHDKIRKSIDDTMLQIRPLPKDFQDWADKIPFKESRYIMYQYSRKKYMDGYCTHCKKQVKVLGAKHQGKGICPNCKSRVTFLAAGRTSEFTDEKKLIYIQPGKDGEIIFRYFQCFRDYENNGYKLSCYETIKETEREFYFADKIYRYDAYGNHPHNWYQVYDRHIYERGYVYNRNMKRVLKEAVKKYKHIQYIPIAKMLRNIGTVSAAQFYISVIDNPEIEYLVKLGLYRLCTEVINDEYTELGNISGNILKELKLNKQDIQYIRQHDMGYKDILLYNDCKKYDVSLFPEIKNFLKNYADTSSRRLFEIMEYVRWEKIKPYIEEQMPNYTNRWWGSDIYKRGLIVSDWYDYIENCKQLGYDMRDTKVVRPKNLQERHDAVMEFMRLKQQEANSQKIRYRYYENVYTLSYSDKKYSVILPSNIYDIKYEGDELHHCVYTNYASRVAEGRSIILFIRKNSEFYKPFVTLEINPETYEQVQMRGYDNCVPDKEVQAFYKKYESKVLNKLKEKRRAA